MQFETRFREPIARGSVDLTFRRWKRPQAVAGNTYRTAAGRLVVDDVRVVAAGDITDGEARRAGYPSAAALVADPRGDAALPVYRVAFHPAPGPDPRDELAAGPDLSDDEAGAILAKLVRLDRASAPGPGAQAALALGAAKPGGGAGRPGPHLGQELLGFKLNVRKLKNLGLTISLGTGYRLSPRGQAFLRRGV